MITQLKFASIPVSDQDRALEFYTEQLGFQVMTDQPMGDQRWIELAIPGAETRVVLFTMDEHRDRIGTPSNISFQSGNVQQTYEQLTERGVRFDQAPRQAPWGTWTSFKDPDGNTFMLSSR